MAQIDVTDLFADPDFCDEMQLINRVPKVTSRGVNVLVDSPCLPSVGSVQPASGRTLARLPEALRQANVKSFWFRGTITASSPGKYSAILIFRGERYQVQTVQDWTNWGEGWCEGTCVAEDPS